MTSNGGLPALIQTQLEPDGVLLATIDMPGRTMNVFSADLMDALEALMDQVEADSAVKSVVLTSGKPSFLAGADLAMVRGYCDAARSLDHDAMFALCGRLGRQFVRLEASAKPWVAAVNGVALGGGLELALACRVRIVAETPNIQLGVPEVKLGLLPGAGGTQRLPRLVGLAAAMDLLITGRSLAPAEAVRLGLFARAVPAAALLDEARRVARSLHGTGYNEKIKFAHLGQVDVPVWGGATARLLVLKEGVSAEDFAMYPAYSAIVDSVLKGARLPLAEATTLEMNQFLRLMFNPVAGRMVRTLFLERLRGEREQAAPPATRVERLAYGAISPGCEVWRQAIDKLKLPKSADDTLPEDTLALFDQSGVSHRISLGAIQGNMAAKVGGSLVVLAPAGPHGRVLEFVTGDQRAADALAWLAARLWCLPWRTCGPKSVLQQLNGQPLAVQAQVALRCAATSAGPGPFAGAGDLAYFDVAACLGGVTPAWTGGPLTWLWAEQDQQRPGFDAATQAAWVTVHGALEQACA